MGVHEKISKKTVFSRHIQNLKQYNKRVVFHRTNILVCVKMLLAIGLAKRVEIFLEAIKRLERSTILIIIVMPRKGINNH